jgi:ABC-2 type transport system ATP-binding protein
VRRGEVYGYLGPNGAGKTTTIRLLLDFIRPTDGTYTVLGSTGTDAEVRRRIGYVPGELRFDPRHTTNDLIDFYGRLRGGVERTYADSLLERFDLDPTRPIGHLSTGNRRKVAIVQGFMHRPELFVLDEPTTGLDPLLQHEFQRLARDVVGDGATVFLSSHVLPEVEVMADRVGILRRGKLVTVAGITELQRRARQRLDLHVSGEATAKPFARLPGVVGASIARGVVRLVVEGDVDRVIKAAAKMHVRRVVTHETDLEEVFLDLYRGDG